MQDYCNLALGLDLSCLLPQHLCSLLFLIDPQFSQLLTVAHWIPTHPNDAESLNIQELFGKRTILQASASASSRSAPLGASFVPEVITIKYYTHSI